MKLSKRISELRETAAWSQEELARKAGVSQQLISKLESGRALESRKLPKIAKAFGLSVDQLLDGVSMPALEPQQHEYSTKEKAIIAAYWAVADESREMIDRMLLGDYPPPGAPQRKTAARSMIDDKKPSAAKKRVRRIVG